MHGNRAKIRWQRRRTIKRKLGVLRRIGGEELAFSWTGGEPGRLSKGKIHCSCPLCRLKSSEQIAHRDAKKHANATSQLSDLSIKSDNV